MNTNRFAAIDLGSNSFLITIVETSDHSIRTLYEDCIITQISSELGGDGVISAHGIDRGLSAVIQFRAILDSYEISRVSAAATAVFRKAINADVFINAAEVILDTHIDIISGAREAQLSYQSVICDLVIGQSKDVCMVDLGGGSAEFAFMTGNEMSLNSYPIGAIAIKNELCPHDPMSYEEIQRIHQIVDLSLQDFKTPQLSLVGVGGAFVNLGGAFIGKFHPETIHGITLDIDTVDELGLKLCGMCEADRKEIPGIEPQRAGVIHISSQIISAIMHVLNQQHITISAKGLRWGLVYEVCSCE